MCKISLTLPQSLAITSILISISALLLTPSSLLPYRLNSLGVNSHIERNSRIRIPLFEDHTLQAGINSQHVQGGKRLSGLNETLGSGACAFDYDNDGLTDIFAIGGSGQTRFYGRPDWWQKKRGNTLYKNLGDTKFVDVTLKSKLTTQVWGMGCTTADFDNDGDQDLILTNIGQNIFYRNNGDGTFSDITRDTGITGANWSTSAAIGDYDNDGLLDIYIVNYINFQKGARTLEKSSGFRAQLNTPFNPQFYNSQPNRLYRNTGNLKFKDVTESAGVANISGRGLSATWLDVNTDLQPDLIIANDAGLPNSLFINNGDGRFMDATAHYNLNTSKSTRSITTGDIDNDGDTDLLMSTDNITPLVTYLKGTSPAYKIPVNNNHTAFNDRGRDLGFADELKASLNTWGISLQDFNNDGWLDLFSVNGYTTPDPDSPRLPKGQPKQMWLNKGNGTFTRCDHCGEDLQIAMSGRGITIADFDNDGDIDAYVSNNNDIGQLLINQSAAANWINIHLEGTTSNRDAIGTKVIIRTSNGNQTRVVDGNPSFLSSGDKRIHFGLDNSASIDKITILWPDGEKQFFNHINANQFIFIKQDQDKYTTVKVKNSKYSSSKLLFTNPSHRIAAISWLMNGQTKQLAEQELILSYKNKDPTIRHRVIKLAGLHHSPASLSILLKALKDNDIKNKLTAIHFLQALEDEMSVSWLLHGFNDKSSKVRCAVADTFSFFFREEEAVINHKYFAVPYLIKMLGDEETEARACAARALGDAELYRGARPLIKLLNDKETDVRVEAARALGLIREKIATPYLLKIIANPSQPAAVKFHSIIALKRLEYPDITKLISNTLNTATINKNYTQTHNLTHALLMLVSKPEDGAIIRSSFISEIIFKWLKNTPVSHSRNKKLLKSQLAAIDILGKTKNRKASRQIKKLLNSRYGDFRASAYIFMTRINNNKTYKYIISGLKDKSVNVKNKLLTFIVKENIKTPVNAIISIPQNDKLELLKIQALSNNHSNKSANYLVKVSANSHFRTKVRIEAIKILSTLNIKKLPALPVSIHQEPNDSIRMLALQYWSDRNKNISQIKSMPVHLSSAVKDNNPNVRRAALNAIVLRHEPWVLPFLYKNLFNNNTVIEIKEDILHQISAIKSPKNISTLIRLAKRKNNKLSIDALKSLAKYPKPEVIAYLYSVFNNPNEAETYRFAAAQSLIAIDPAAKSKMLFNTIN